MLKCRICGKEFKYDRQKGHRKNGMCGSCSVSEARKRRKKLLVEYKGGKCSMCGYDKCVSALEFHHTNPKEKDISFSNGAQRKLELMIKEVDKCILVCSNCHREIHAGVA